MKYLFILNPISGAKKHTQEIFDSIDEQMSRSGQDYEFAFTTRPGDATHISSSGVAEGFDMIVAAGGDGTINEVASGLVGSNVFLGILPLGSGNGIARSLGVALGLKEAIRQILQPSFRTIDVGKINDRYFVGICGIGLDANIGKKFQDFGVRGPLPYFLIGIKEFLLYRAEEYTVLVDERHLEYKPLLIAIANTHQYGNGARIAPQADPCDGMLDLCILPEVNFLKALSLTRQLFRGAIHTTPEYQHFRCKKLKIRSAHGPCIIHTDGEPHVESSELNIQIFEKALTVCTGKIPD